MLKLIETEQEDGAMPSDKAVFGSNDTNPVTYDPDDLHTRKYMGPEKRRNDREYGGRPRGPPTDARHRG